MWTIATRTYFRSLALTSVGHFVNDGTVFFVPMLADIFASQKDVTPLQVTAMFIVFYASSSILSVYVGRLADKTGRSGPMIGLGLAFLSLGMLGFYISIVYAEGIVLSASIIVSAFVAGFGSSFYHPLGAAVLQSEFDDTSMGKALGVNGAAGSFGRALYPSLFFLIGAFLRNYGSIAFFAAIGFIASATISIGLKDQELCRVRHSTERKRKASDIVTKGIMAVTLVAFIRSLATQGILAWIPIYISTQKGAGVTTALGLELTIMYSTAIIGQPVFGWLVDRFDKRLVLAISSAGSALSIVAYLFTSGWGETIVLSLFGFFSFSAFPLLLSLASDYSPIGSSFGNALVWGLGSSGGSIIGPVITDAIILNDYTRLGTAFEIMALAAILSGFGATLIPKPKDFERK